ncbi:spore cortex biosynthesis protein YabQ [Bacillus sp. CGMCC 1.16607]|uniref:spore cortex biosynthesis protein YabQ n=1 Tax=Bacillus sp. CGMCC 1.16607 TaxID=3351842 RepID=UPI003643016A
MTLSTQFITMLSMVGMGVLFGTSLDTYQRFLNRPNRKRWFVFLNDILFWLTQGLSIFYTLFLVNQGEIRFYIFLALLCGFAAYQSLFKRLYLSLLETGIQICIATYRFGKKTVITLFWKPIVWLVGLTITILLALGRGSLSVFRLIYKLLKFIIFILSRPIVWILLIFWKLMPKKIKKIVEKIYNKWAGNFSFIKNYFSSWIQKWKKPKE